MEDVERATTAERVTRRGMRRSTKKILGLFVLVVTPFVALLLVLFLAFSFSWPRSMREVEEATVARLGSVHLVDRSETMFVALRGVRWSCDRMIRGEESSQVPGVGEEGGRLVFATVPRIHDADACVRALESSVGRLEQIPDATSDFLRAHGHDVITTAGGWPLFYRVTDVEELRSEPTRNRRYIAVTTAWLVLVWLLRASLAPSVRVALAGEPLGADRSKKVRVPCATGFEEVTVHALDAWLPDRIAACGGEPQKLYTLVCVCLQEGFDDLAARVAAELLRLQPDVAAAYALSAHIARLRLDFEQAEAIVAAWESSIGRSSTTCTERALNLLAEERAPEAFGHAAMAVELDENDCDAVRTLVDCGVAASRLEEVWSNLRARSEREEAWAPAVFLVRVPADGAELERLRASLAACMDRSPELVERIFGELCGVGAFDDARALASPIYDPARHGARVGVVLVADLVHRDRRGDAATLANLVRPHADDATRAELETALRGS
jgi:hypothetical protein